jgi:hypothetical protein
MVVPPERVIAFIVSYIPNIFICSRHCILAPGLKNKLKLCTFLHEIEGVTWKFLNNTWIWYQYLYHEWNVAWKTSEMLRYGQQVCTYASRINKKCLRGEFRRVWAVGLCKKHLATVSTSTNKTLNYLVEIQTFLHFCLVIRRWFFFCAKNIYQCIKGKVAILSFESRLNYFVHYMTGTVKKLSLDVDIAAR